MTDWINTPKTNTPATYSLLIDDANHFLLIDDSDNRLLLQDEDLGTPWVNTPKT